MEFFAIANIETDPETLQELTVRKLNQFCADIDKVLHVESDNSADVYCVWGEYTVHRQPINGGVRFSIPDCPNALVLRQHDIAGCSISVAFRSKAQCAGNGMPFPSTATRLRDATETPCG